MLKASFCLAPGSGEAFKKVGTAMEVLSKPEKRRHFDAYDSDDEYDDQWDIFSLIFNSFDFTNFSSMSFVTTLILIEISV